MLARDATAKLPAPETTAGDSPGARGAVEGGADRRQGALLAVEVGAVGRGRRHQHGARRGARDPDAAFAARRMRRRQRLGDAHGLAGRVAVEDRLQQRAGRRAEQGHGVVDGVAQARRREPARVDGGAERVAVREDEAAGVGPGRGVAVVDRCEQLAGAQLRGEPARGVGARCPAASPLAPRARLRCRSGPGARSRRSSAGRAARPARASARSAGRPRDRRRSGRARRSPRRRAAAPSQVADGDAAAPASVGRGHAHGEARAVATRLDRHRRSIAVGQQHLYLARHRLAPRDAHRGDLAAQAQVARHELERPLRGTARDAGLEQPLERLAVAGQRAAQRLDDHRGFGRGVERHRPAAIAQAHRQGVAGDDELLVARLQRLAHEAVGRAEREPAARRRACGRSSRRGAARRRSPRPTSRAPSSAVSAPRSKRGRRGEHQGGAARPSDASSAATTLRPTGESLRRGGG